MAYRANDAETKASASKGGVIRGLRHGGGRGGFDKDKEAARKAGRKGGLTRARNARLRDMA